jgi:uncharacterized protein with von Willebrand factor type A (vWA) domain
VAEVGSGGPDVAAVAVGLGRALRDAGVAVTPERSTRFARALELLPPADRRGVYWAARLSFVSSRAELDILDRVFDALLSAAPLDPADSRGQEGDAPSAVRPSPVMRSGAPGLAGGGAASLLAALSGAETAGTADDAREATLAAASSVERLGERDFATLSPDELARVRALVARLALDPPLRRARRVRRHRRGPHVDVRASLRRSLRTGGDPVRLRRRRRIERPRRVVMLLDVSGSMEPYARALAGLLQGAATGARAEVFVFATRLTRVTRELRGPEPEAALVRAAAAAPDWAGGTRIGSALAAFNAEYARRLARGAVVVVLSDGWERDDPERLGSELARLRRLAHRVVWVNPRTAAPAFAPLAGGMAAALPHCDELVSGHSLDALGDVLAAITRH